MKASNLQLLAAVVVALTACEGEGGVTMSDESRAPEALQFTVSPDGTVAGRFGPADYSGVPEATLREIQARAGRELANAATGPIQVALSDEPLEGGASAIVRREPDARGGEVAWIILSPEAGPEVVSDGIALVYGDRLRNPSLESQRSLLLGEREGGVREVRGAPNLRTYGGEEPSKTGETILEKLRNADRRGVPGLQRLRVVDLGR